MTATASRRGERLAGALLAILVQAGVIALLVVSRSPTPPPEQVAKELIFFLPRLAPLPAAKTSSQSAKAPPLAAPAPALPAMPPNPIAPPARPAAPSLSNFGQALFGCDMDHYADMTADGRRHCLRPGEGYAVRTGPNPMGAPDHVKDEAHWEEEWAREKSPALLPCLGFVDVICLLEKIADGSLSDYGDPRTWPHYAVKQLPKSDFYKIEQAYDAWHHDHPVQSTATAAAAAQSAAGAP